jgi:hypothetical protein
LSFFSLSLLLRMLDNRNVKNPLESDTPLSRKVGKGLIWVSANTVCGISLHLLSSVILARLLVPSDFGVMAIVMAIITLTQGTLTGWVRIGIDSEAKKAGGVSQYRLDVRSHSMRHSIFDRLCCRTPGRCVF